MSGDEAAAELGRLLAEAGARPTFDARRNCTHPCWRCGTRAAPRALVVIGRYERPMGGGLQPGDAISRPLCAACEEATRPGPEGSCNAPAGVGK